MSEKTAKALRIASLPPIMAIPMTLILWPQFPTGHGWLALLFLTVLPLLAYPIQAAVPCLAAQGRSGQRRLALLFSVAGYAAGLIVSLVWPSTKTERMLYLCYIFSGVLIAFFSKCLHIKNSGHAAGTAGPVSMLVLRVSPWFLLAYLLLIPVYLSSLKLKRHTRAELLWGTAYPIAAAVLLEWIL